MINLIVSVFGALLVIGGFYFMYLGFNVPPNPLAFFVGLIAAVFGLILLIFFGSKIDLSKKPMARPKKAAVPKSGGMAVKKPKKIPPKDKKPTEDKPRVIKPKPRVREQPKFGPAQTSTPTIKKETAAKPGKAIKPKKMDEGKITPQVQPTKAPSKPTTPPSDITSKEKITPRKIAPVKKASEDKKPGKITPTKKEEATKPSIFKKKETPATTAKKEEPVPAPKKEEPALTAKKEEPGKTPEPSSLKEKEEKVKPPAPKSVLETADKERLKELQTRSGRDDQFVKNRLDKLKANYIQNAKDIETIIDDRLDSFKGTIDKLKSESTEPSIIWSFEAQDVQEAMKDTIGTAENKLLMMYPWVRNIDVSILKKFMDTESRMIIQEASLDDDASVELIKLLQEKNVQIKTMPHVHTVAVVADENNGLIISTDPIYESYEVGVIYKDKKSILEIERMFEDAWGISKEIDLEIKQ